MGLAVTRYFGVQEYAQDALIRMPAGMPGFDDDFAFLLIQLPDQFPLVYLQSTQRPDVCFPALPVRVLEASYVLELSDEDAEELGVPAEPIIGSDVLCLTLLAALPSGTTANMRAPVVVNIATRQARQCLNTACDYSYEHALEESAAT